jgi:hypothetical protein
MLARRCWIVAANSRHQLILPELNAGLYTRSHTAAAAADGATRGEAGLPDVRQAFSYCVDQVKKHDYENYLWIMQLPKVRTRMEKLAVAKFG